MAAIDAGLLCGMQRRFSLGHGLLPSCLQLGKLLFTHVATIAPAFCKLTQSAGGLLPVLGLGVCRRPRLDFIDQR